MATTFTATTRIVGVSVAWNRDQDRPSSVLVRIDDDDDYQILRFSNESETQPGGRGAEGSDERALQTAIHTAFANPTTGFLNADGDRVDLLVSSHPRGVTDVKDLEANGDVNPLDGTSYARVRRARRFDSFGLEIIPPYDEDDTYTEKGTAVLHNGNVYVKKSATTSAISGIEPGSIGNTHWGLLFDGTVPTSPATALSDWALSGALALDETTVAAEADRTVAADSKIDLGAAAPAVDTSATVLDHALLVAHRATAADEEVEVRIPLATVNGWTASDTLDTAAAQELVTGLYLARQADGNLALFSVGQERTRRVRVEAEKITPATSRVIPALAKAIGQTTANRTVHYLPGVVYRSTATASVPTKPPDDAGTVTKSAITTAPTDWQTDSITGSASALYVWATHPIVSEVNGAISHKWVPPYLVDKHTATPTGTGGILRRRHQALLADQSVSVDANANAATAIVPAASVPTATQDVDFDAGVRFIVAEGGVEDDPYWVPLSQIAEWEASDTYAFNRATTIYYGSGFTIAVFKMANGDLNVHKVGGTGTTAVTIDADYYYFTETVDRVAEAIQEIVDSGAGYLSGIEILGPVYKRTETDTAPATPTGGTITNNVITAAPDGGWSVLELAATDDEHFVWASYCLHRSDSSFAWLHPILEAQSTALRQTVAPVASHESQAIVASDSNAVATLPAAGGLDERFRIDTNVDATGAGVQRTWIPRATIDGWTKSDTPADATRKQILNDQGLLLEVYVNASGELRVYCVNNTNSHAYDITVKSYRIVEGMERIVDAIRSISQPALVPVRDDLAVFEFSTSALGVVNLKAAPSDPDILLPATDPTAVDDFLLVRIRWTFGPHFDNTWQETLIPFATIAGWSRSDTYTAANAQQVFVRPNPNRPDISLLIGSSGQFRLRIIGVHGLNLHKFDFDITRHRVVVGFDRVREAIRAIVGDPELDVVWRVGTGDPTAANTDEDEDTAYFKKGQLTGVGWTVWFSPLGTNTFARLDLSGLEKATDADVDAETDDAKYTTVDKVFRAIARKVKKATNADVDAETDDTKYTTVAKVFRAIARKVKNASMTVRGIVLMARNVDVDATETEPSRALDVTKGKRLIERIVPAWAREENAPEADDPILSKTEVPIATQENIGLLPDASVVLIAGVNIPTVIAGHFDDRIRIRAGITGQPLTETWVTPAALSALTPADLYNAINSILVHTAAPVTIRLRRLANGNLVATRLGGSGSINVDVLLERHYFSESQDRVQEALQEATHTVGLDALLSIKLPPVDGQFAVYQRIFTNLPQVTDLISGRLQFYSSTATGGTDGGDRQVLGTWSDVLGSAASGLGSIIRGSSRRFMLVHRTEFRNRNLSAFYHQLGYHYWTYPCQVLVFADHNQWVLFSGNLIGNSADIAENHCNFYLERVIDFDLSGTTRESVIPTDLQIKWGFQGDTDTVLAQKVTHSRYRLGGANQPTLPTLADWDGSAFATGNANQTTEQPPSQDESTSTHLWVFTATSTRTAGVGGAWSTTAWAARRATDPDSTAFSAQWSNDPAGNSSASGPWYNRAQDAGTSGTIRFRLDGGEWFYASYGPPPTIPELQVQYSATETGGYSSTVRTEGWYRFKLSTETTWAGPFPIASSAPTIEVEYSANSNGPWSTTVRTTGYYRWKLSTQSAWTGPFEIAGDTTAPVPTLEVQYSATESGTYTSTVRTDGFFRFRYNNGPWIGPSEIGATAIPAAPEPSALPWRQMFAYHMPTPAASVVHDLVNVDDLDTFDEIEFRTQRTGTDGAVATHRMRIAEIPVTNRTPSNAIPTGTPVKLTHTRDGLQVSIGSDQTESGSLNGRSVGLIYFQRDSGVTTGRQVKRIWHRGLQISSASELHTAAFIR